MSNVTLNLQRPRSAESAILGERRTVRSRGLTWVGWGGIALVGAALGVSQTVNGAYDESTWAPIALGALALVLALAIGVPRRPPLALLLPLLGLWLWSLISSGWSDSVDNSVIAANRWLLYAAATAVLWWLVQNSRRRAAVLLLGVGAGVVGVAGWMLAQMLSGHGPSLYLEARLNDPLGYINGEATFLLVGAWPCLALAEWRGSGVRAMAAGAGLAGVVALVGLGLLTQSRGWAFAVIGSVVLVLAAIPGRRRRAVALLLVGAAIALIYSTESNAWLHPNQRTGVSTSSAIDHAALAIVIASLTVGAIWTVAVLALESLAPRGSRSRTHAVWVTSAGLAVVGLGAVIAVGVNASAIGHRIHRQYDAFVHDAPSPQSSRLLSGGGYRYDDWRIAMIEFRSAPVLGVGAGNYEPGYYLHRRTNEDVQQAHSIEFQTLAELGIVGALLLAAFLITVGIGFARTGRAANRDPLARAVAVAGGGIFAAWLLQTSVDWMHLIPGLTAIALAGAVALRARPESRSPILAGRWHVAMIAAATAVAVTGVVTIAPRVLSLHATASAQRALAEGRPKAAITDATRALDYDPHSVLALTLRAAGFARLHAFAPTLADLQRAIAVEPRNWATWALLGDLYTRRGDRRAARSAYARAVALDPRDKSLLSAAETSA